MLLFSYCLGENSKFLQLDFGYTQVHSLNVVLGLGKVKILFPLNEKLALRNTTGVTKIRAKIALHDWS